MNRVTIDQLHRPTLMKAEKAEALALMLTLAEQEEGDAEAWHYRAVHGAGGSIVEALDADGEVLGAL